MKPMAGMIAALVALLISVPAGAEVRIGALVGANVANLNVDIEDPDVTFSSKTFPAAGLVIDVDLTNRVSVRFEPMYLQKGSKFELRNFFGEDVRASFTFSYIELPVFLKVSKASGSVRPYLILGPSVGYRTGLSIKDEVTGDEPTAEELDELDETFEKWDFGVSAGGGLSFNVGRSTVFAEGRYTWGLTRLNKDEREDATVKNRGVQVLVGFTVPIGRK